MTLEMSAPSVGTRLRAWRTRRGLSQLELAIRTATSQRHISFLEQGRSRPGRSMLIRLAESLELPLRDRNTLLLDAGFAPVYPASDLDGAELEPVRQALDHVLAGFEPFPAIVVRPNGDIVARNAATALLFEEVDPALLAEPINAYRVALHPRGMAPRIANFDDWAQHVVINLRIAAVRYDSSEIAALVDELSPYAPAHPPGPDHLGFAVPIRLRSSRGDLTLMTAITTFATAVDVTVSELRLESFLPADAATAAALRDETDAIA